MCLFTHRVLCESNDPWHDRRWGMKMKKAILPASPSAPPNPRDYRRKSLTIL